MQLKTARPLLDRLHFSCLVLAKSLCEISMVAVKASGWIWCPGLFLQAGNIKQAFLHIYHKVFFFLYKKNKPCSLLT